MKLKVKNEENYPEKNGTTRKTKSYEIVFELFVCVCVVCCVLCVVCCVLCVVCCVLCCVCVCVLSCFLF